MLNTGNDSEEFIDFLLTRERLSEIEAANELRITKTPSAASSRWGGTVRIETHIVDVSSGVLEAPYTTQGREIGSSSLPSEVEVGQRRGRSCGR